MRDMGRTPVFLDNDDVRSLDYAETILQNDHDKYNGGLGGQDIIVKGHCSMLRRALETLNKIRQQQGR